MSDTAAAPVATPTPAAEAAKPAGGPAQKGETFSESMARLAATQTEGSDDAANIETDAAGTPEPEKPAVAPKDKPRPENEKLSQLKALADELGLEMDAGRVSPKERIEFRAWKKRQQEALENDRRSLIEQFNEAKGSFQQDVSRATAITSAFDAGDYEGLAKALGKKDWNEVQDEIIAKNSDPNFKKLRELEQWKAEQETEKVRREEAEFAQQQQTKRDRARSGYMQQLSEQMKKSKDPVLRELHDDDLLVHTIFKIQEENWDGSGTVSPEQALRMSVRGGKSAAVEHLKALHERLNRAFGTGEAPAPVNTDKPGVKPKPKSAPVSPAEKDAASPPKSMNKKQWSEYEHARLAEAINADRLAEGAEKRRG